MKNKKLFALIVAVLMLVSICVPGMLAFGEDSETSTSDFAIETPAETPTEGETAEPTTPTEGETAEPTTPTEGESAEPTTPTEGESAEPTTPTEGETAEPTTPTEGETAEPTTPTEGETAEPTTPTEGETAAPATPTEGETAEPTTPAATPTIDKVVAEYTVYSKAMACTTIDELYLVLDAMTEDEYNALTAQQKLDIEAKIAALEPQPLPEIVIEPTTDVVVPSEIYTPAKSYTEVAPFGDPVTGE